MVGERFNPIASWRTKSDLNVQGVAGGQDRALSAWVKLNSKDKGGKILTWGDKGAGRKWSLGVMANGKLAVYIGGALKLARVIYAMASGTMSAPS